MPIFSPSLPISPQTNLNPFQDWCQNSLNQMDKGAELFLFKVQIFTQSAVLTMATHPWSTLLGTWTTEVIRIYSSLSNIPLSCRVRRRIPLDRYLDIFLVLIQLMLHKKNSWQNQTIMHLLISLFSYFLFLLVYLVIWSLTTTLNFIHWYIPHPKVNISSWPPYTLGLLSDS